MAEHVSKIIYDVVKRGTGIQEVLDDMKKVAAEAARVKDKTSASLGDLAGGDMGGAIDALLTRYPLLATAQDVLGVNFTALAGKATGAVSVLKTVGPAIMGMAGIAVAAASSVGSLLVELDALREKEDQARASFDTQAGSAQVAAESLSAMNAKVGLALTNIEKMGASGAIMASGMNLSADAAANLANIAVNLGAKTETAAQRVAGLTAIMASGRTAGLGAYGISITEVETRATELMAATDGLSKVEATRQAIFEAGTRNLDAYIAAGGKAVTQTVELSNAIADYKSALATNVNLGNIRSEFASFVEGAAIKLQMDSGDAQTQLVGLQSQLQRLQALQAELDAKPIHLAANANRAEIDELIARIAQLKAMLGEEARWAAGVERLRGGAQAANNSIAGLSEALAQLRGKEDTLMLNAVAAGILAGKLDEATVAADGLAKSYLKLTKPESILGAMQAGTNPGSPLGPMNVSGISPLSLLTIAENKSNITTDPAFAAQQERERLKHIQLVQSAAERAAAAIKAKWDALASSVTTALDDARNKAKGLFDLGAGIVTEPGKNGPFEALYRITDIAATMAGRAPGADTAQWQQMYAGQDAMSIAKNFQAGNLLAPGVFENIDWQMLGAQATQQQEAGKLSTYAGQAVADLTKAGKPLTAENIKAAVEELANKDKAGIVPELQNVSQTVKDTGDTAHGDAANVIGGLSAINGTIAKLLPTNAPPPPAGETAPPKGPPAQSIPPFAAGTASAPGGLAIVGERGAELVNLPAGAQVFTASQTDNILQGLALRSFASGTPSAPGGMALVGERGPELIQLQGQRDVSPQPRSQGEPQMAAQFMTELARALNGKARTMQQAGDVMADMLIGAAAANVQEGLLRQLTRR